MDSLQFYPNSIMQDGDEVITYMHVNGLTSSNNQAQEGSAAVLLLLFFIFFYSQSKEKINLVI